MAKTKLGHHQRQNNRPNDFCVRVAESNFATRRRLHFYLIFTSLEISGARLPVLNRTVSLLSRSNLIVGRAMLAKTGVNIQIDDIHSRAICAEIGDRFREILRAEVSSELPPRLHYLLAQLAEADCETAPSLVPSLEDMIEQEAIIRRQERSACESFGAQMV